MKRHILVSIGDNYLRSFHGKGSETRLTKMRNTLHTVQQRTRQKESEWLETQLGVCLL